MSNKVYILIPTHNRKDHLRKCLRCIQNQTYKDIVTVVIDDGSTDGTAEMLAKELPEATVLKGNGNLWWGGAMRMGIDYVLGKAKKGDFVLLMNDDTIFGSDYLRTIIGASKRYNRAIIGSICFDARNKKKVIEAGVIMNWSRGRLDVPLRLPRDYKKRKAREVDTFCGRGTLVPVEVFREVGNYSRRLPHYLSDYEYFIRAKNAGFKLLISYKAVTYATKEFGGIKFRLQKIGLKRFLQEAFSRRSKSNIIDRINFILLAVPKGYRTKNLLKLFKGLLFRQSFVSPFYYLQGTPLSIHKMTKFFSGLIWCIKRRLKGLTC